MPLDMLDRLAQQYGNVVKYDADGKPSIFVPIPKVKSIDLDPSLPDHVHPAFVVNGTEHDRILVGKYLAAEVAANGTLYSIANVPPRVSLGSDELLARMRAFNGASGKTAAISGLILLLARKYNWVPKGNNYYGTDYRDGTPWEVGKSYTVGTKRVYLGVEYACVFAHTSAWENRPDVVPDYWTKGKRIGGVPVASQISNSVPNGYNTLNGSGPISWMHDGTVNGIADLVGNTGETDYGYRVFGGEIQIIENNNALHPSADLSAASAAWKAILPNTNDNGHTLVAPGTAGTLKWDSQNSKPVLSTTITTRMESYQSVAFASLTKDASLPYVPAILQELGIFPIVGDDTQGMVYYNNAVGTEFLPRRGGNCNYTSYTGLGCEYVSNSRGHSTVYNGARPAFVELDS